MARVNTFLKMVRGGKVKDSYRKADQDIARASANVIIDDGVREENFLTEEDFIPTYQEYTKMCENDYAIGVIQNALSTPKYDVGTLVMARTSFPNFYKVKDKLLLIVEHSTDVRSHAKGAKPVSVLPIGQTSVLWTEERYLKLPKKKKV